MPEEPLDITNPNIRLQTPDIDEKLRQFEEQKMRAAEQREAELLNKTGVIDVFIDMIDNIKKRFIKNHVRQK